MKQRTEPAIEDKAAENIQSEQPKEKRIKKNEAFLETFETT